MCHVYPEGYQEPPAGEGLNVPAIVRIVRCWPPNKNDEDAVEDYVEFLRKRPDTEFISYDLEAGKWEFGVKHFSSHSAYDGELPTWQPRITKSGREDTRYQFPRQAFEARSGPKPNPPPNQTKYESTPSASLFTPPTLKPLNLASASTSFNFGQQPLPAPQPQLPQLPQLPQPPHPPRIALGVLAQLNPPVQVMDHVLRSNISYKHDVSLRGALRAFRECYKFWSSLRPIPDAIETKLESFRIANDDFGKLFPNPESEEAKSVFLDEGKLKFVSFPVSPHGEGVFAFDRQFYAQDTLGLFIPNTANRIIPHVDLLTNQGIVLGASNKEPDCAYRIDLARLPNHNNYTFLTLPGKTTLYPVIVFEIAVFNESLKKLEQVDRARYFSASSGVRWWVGCKVFKTPQNSGTTNRWWIGHARRDKVNGTFVNSSTLQNGSMTIPPRPKGNRDINLVYNQTLDIDIAYILDPVPLPPNCPAIIRIDAEALRQVLVKCMYDDG